jgi:uroporphyrinogen decarboxylase
VRKVLAQAEGKPGHVFNLGHGVLPETDPDVLRRIVDLVHEETEAGGSPAPARQEGGGRAPVGGRG